MIMMHTQNSLMLGKKLSKNTNHKVEMKELKPTVKKNYQSLSLSRAPKYFKLINIDINTPPLSKVKQYRR